MFFIATADADGAPDCSYKGGDPGFVRVIDRRRSPSRVRRQRHVPDTRQPEGEPARRAPVHRLRDRTRLRVNGEARIDLDDPLRRRTKVRWAWCGSAARSIFANCRRYVHEYRKVSPSPFVPRDESILPSRTGSSTRGSTARWRPGIPPTTPSGRAPPPSPGSEPTLGFRPGGLRTFTGEG